MNGDTLNRIILESDPQVPSISEMSFCGSSMAATLKRRASPSFDRDDWPSRKRLKEEDSDQALMVDESTTASLDSKFADELAQDLQCGCCSELVYRPVLVMPCQHFFCGSCCVLWIRNGGTNCPACRGVSNIVTPFRALQSVVDTLLRLAPEKARTERERLQADQVYKVGVSLRIPSPKEPSPEPNLHQNSDLAQPCPHCPAGNPHGWRCPRPIADPAADPDHGWHLDEGLPPGHALCGNCENLLALEAPITTKCDLCQVSFCGINIPGRCSAVPLVLQHPQGLSTVSDLIESSEVYDCFDGNAFEVEVVFDYLRNHNITPRHIYRAIMSHVQQQPRGLLPLMESEVFADIHGGGVDSVPQGPFNRICRVCAAEVLLWGLRDWWIRERQKGLLDENITSRPDCPEGGSCDRQKESSHAREFNHIIVSREAAAAVPIEAPSQGPLPLLASSSVDAVENLVNPQTQSTDTPLHRGSMSTLSFLLNASESGGPSGLTLAQRLQASSTADLRDALDALS